MERKRMRSNAALMWVVLVGFVSQNLVMPVMCGSLDVAAAGDQKNSNGNTVQHWNTPRSHPKDPQCKTPSHGSGGGHGGGSHGGGNGGGYDPTPLTPSSPTYNPVTPSLPPPTPTFDPVTPSISPPTPTIDPVTPSIPPPTPTYNPITPSITPPTPAFNPAPTVPDPNIQPSYPGTCTFWGTHPALIWGLFGFWGKMGGIFGPACTSAFGSNLNLQEALLNTRNDGVGSLFREGTASLLNSMATRNFPYTTQQVKEHFVAALVSDKAAAAQAQLFKKANEGHLKL